MPMSHNPSRKLAAILAADIAGYSALMGADEPRTVRDLKGHQAVVLPMVGEHGGRIIDTAGAGVVAEFASVGKAPECAVAIQMTMAERNATVEPTRRMQFRIGVNLGDVIYDETRIYGDGINIAARLEGIAEPGGVFISRQVYEQVDGKVALSFRKLGPRTSSSRSRSSLSTASGGRPQRLPTCPPSGTPPRTSARLQRCSCPLPPRAR